jgi:hypothetical protein
MTSPPIVGSLAAKIRSESYKRDIYVQKLRSCEDAVLAEAGELMSESGQKRRFDHAPLTSGLPSTLADIFRDSRHVAKCHFRTSLQTQLPLGSLRKIDVSRLATSETSALSMREAPAPG